MGKVISVFGSDPKFEEGFIKNGFECQGVLCQTEEVREVYKKHFEGTPTYIFENPAVTQCSCGINNRKPDGIIGVMPDEQLREDGTGGKPQLVMDFTKMLNIGNKPEFFILEYPNPKVIEAEPVYKGEFQHIVDNLGGAGFDIYVQKYDNDRTFFVGFGQDDFVQDFNFPKVEAENEEYDAYAFALAESVKNAVTKSGKRVEELFRKEEQQ